MKMSNILEPDIRKKAKFYPTEAEDDPEFIKFEKQLMKRALKHVKARNNGHKKVSEEKVEKKFRVQDNFRKRKNLEDVMLDFGNEIGRLES